MRYDEIITINENFQYSVNIGFDIGNINKIENYIATRDSIKILDGYLESIINKKNRSTLLIGPYGKGKSHLFLVLLTLINNYTDTKQINKLINKIEELNPECACNIKEIRKEEKKFLPVIINSNYGDIKQAFLLGMKEALERENIEYISTKTDFDAAIEVINNWQNNYAEAFEKYKECLKKYEITPSELLKGLKACNKVSLENFKELYSCVNYGEKFNPLLKNDVITYYENVNKQICENGYKGMFIVFDEFSKFLNNADETNMMSDLKILQDIAELASRSGKEEQIHISCITHKSISEYAKHMAQNKVNAFKTVEGRFKEIHFNRSIDQSYDMISKTIKKKEKFAEVFKKIYKKHEEFYKEIETDTDLGKVKDYKKVIEEGCFPLNPFAAEALIKLSEKIAQNERTLFTFICDSSNDSLKTYVNAKVDKLLSVDKLYDYFETSFIKESSEILNIYLKAKHAIEQADSIDEIKIIKVLAIMKMVSDSESQNLSDKIIRLAADVDKKRFKIIVDDLTKKNNILKRNKRNNLLDFSSVCTKEMFDDITNLINAKFYNIDIKKSLENIYDLGYTIPRMYNGIKKMTRYFKNEFLIDEDILDDKDLTQKLIDDKSDGKVVYILNYNLNIDVEKQMKKFQYENIIYASIKIKEDIIDTLKEYEAIKYMENNSEEYDEIFLKELEYSKLEIMEYINEYIKNEIDKIAKYQVLNNAGEKDKNLSKLVSMVCLNLYKDSPIINNEMINKNILTSPISKARNSIINAYFEENIEYSGTSVEATLYNSTFNVIDKEDNILKRITDNLISDEGKKISFEKIYEILKKPPYAIRDGVIPIYFAMVIKEYINESILYFEKKEIDIDGVNISKIISNPKAYYLKIEKGTSKKIEYIKNILELFNKEPVLEQRKNKALALSALKEYILGLSRIAREAKLDRNTNLPVDKKIVDFRNKITLYDLNQNEFLFETILRIFNTKSYEDAFKQIEAMKIYLDSYTRLVVKKVVEETINKIDKKYKGELLSCLKNWKEKIDENVLKSILPSNTTNILDYISEAKTNNNEAIINKISYILVNANIEDYLDNTYDKYFECLDEVIESVNIKITNKELETFKKIKITSEGKVIEKVLDLNVSASGIGINLKNNIEDSLDEFSSIPTTEKVNILLELLERYL
ncbi:MAG: hypothetical protein RR922_03715 [Clostridia bacterium]